MSEVDKTRKMVADLRKIVRLRELKPFDVKYSPNQRPETEPIAPVEKEQSQQLVQDLQAIQLNQSINKAIIEQSEESSAGVLQKLQSMKEIDGYSRIRDVVAPSEELPLYHERTGFDGQQMDVFRQYIELFSQIKGITRTDVETLHGVFVRALRGMPPTATQQKKLTVVAKKLRDLEQKIALDQLPRGQQDEWGSLRQLIPTLQQFIDKLPDYYRERVSLRNRREDLNAINYDDSNRDLLRKIAMNTRPARPPKGDDNDDDDDDDDDDGDDGGDGKGPATPKKSARQPPSRPPPPTPSTPPPPTPPTGFNFKKRSASKPLSPGELRAVSLSPPRPRVGQKEMKELTTFGKQDKVNAEMKERLRGRRGKGFPKLSESGKFGLLMIDMEKLQKMQLLVRKHGRKILGGPLSNDLYLLLTKRFNPKHKYSQLSLDEFCKLVELAELPTLKAECGKGKLIKKAKAPRAAVVEPTVKYVSSGDDMVRRLVIALGEIDAGNTNPSLIEEASSILGILKSNGVVTEEQYLSTMERLM